ncbi:MAG: purine-nucleoside phosphorylase [Lachnospiraceae bacterium]|nr:purine-nucleoside phosphorylase [Lachnospiraceae bacterium]
MELKIPTPHIEAKEGEIAPNILLPGDPLRAKFIAENFLAGAKQFNSTRNMLGYTGFYRDVPVSVMGTGMGGPSIGIYSHELIHGYGVKRLIRVGTAGALQESVHVRDLVFAMGACSEAGYITKLGLPGIPALTCSFGMLVKGVYKAADYGISYHVGNVVTSDVFYAPEKRVEGGLSFADMGALAVEMESAVLYANAALAGVEALSILTISDSMVTGESTDAKERETSFEEMMQVALDIFVP